MKLYFYHGQDVGMILSEWQQMRYPGHLLYGATHLPQHGLDIIPHLYGPQKPSDRWKLTWRNAWHIWKRRKEFDAVYATAFRGLEVLIFMRALGLFRKPIYLWHHQPIRKAKNLVREAIARLFYRGMDRLFFFSQPIMDESLKSPKADAARMTLIHWGPDLAFYDHILRQRTGEQAGFITTGKELRDLPTLLQAFSQARHPLDMYINPSNGGLDYANILAQSSIPENIHIHEINRLMIGELAKTVAQAKCVVICCLRANYTVGLTTLMEALALGLPVVCTKNPTFPFDIDAEGVGITVAHGDVEGWVRAINYIASHPAEAEVMGQRGRRLAETTFNLPQMAAEIAKAINADLEKRRK